LPQELEETFARAQSTLAANLAELKRELQRLDPTLVDAASRSESKMHYQLERLQARAARAKLRRSEDLRRHADQLTAALYANKELQERSLPGVQMLAQHDTELLDQLLGCIRLECRDHQVVFI
jgi:hypothetical protein